MRTKTGLYIYFTLILAMVCGQTAIAQEEKKEDKKADRTSAQVGGKPVMWAEVDASTLDLYAGPGGEAMRPDISKIEFIKEEKEGHNKKYRIKDGSGRVWVAKLGREAQPETAAVRLIYGLGYKTEVNYLVPMLNIPGKGTFKNVRLEARPENAERLEEWKWRENPFVGTKELQGLKMMMVFLNNWDVLDLQNKVVAVDGELHYIVSDLGATFGRLGNNNLPVVYRFGRKTGSPEHYSKTSFVDDVVGTEVKLSYKGKNKDLFEGFTVADAQWLSQRFEKLSDKQIGDAFRAANYQPDEIAQYVNAVRAKINELKAAAAGSGDVAAGN